MDIEKHQSALIQKQLELEAEIVRAHADGLEARVAEVEDEIDAVTSEQEQAIAFEESSMLSETLESVRAALQRMEDGAYGRCIDCGREIGEARLNAVPWTPYCIEDQERHDKQRADAQTAGKIS